MSLSSFHFFEKDDCCSFEDCEGSFKCGKDNCQGPFFTDGQDCCSDKIAVGQDCCSGKIAARTSATEAEAAAAKNIPVGKVKETATANPLRKRNNCAKGTTFTDAEDCCSAKCDGGNGGDGCCSEESPCG